MMKVMLDNSAGDGMMRLSRDLQPGCQGGVHIGRSARQPFQRAALATIDIPHSDLRRCIALSNM